MRGQYGAAEGANEDSAPVAAVQVGHGSGLLVRRVAQGGVNYQDAENGRSLMAGVIQKRLATATKASLGGIGQQHAGGYLLRAGLHNRKRDPESPADLSR